MRAVKVRVCPVDGCTLPDCACEEAERRRLSGLCPIKEKSEINEEEPTGAAGSLQDGRAAATFGECRQRSTAQFKQVMVA